METELSELLSKQNDGLHLNIGLQLQANISLKHMHVMGKVKWHIMKGPICYEANAHRKQWTVDCHFNHFQFSFDSSFSLSFKMAKTLAYLHYAAGVHNV